MQLRGQRKALGGNGVQVPHDFSGDGQKRLEVMSEMECRCLWRANTELQAEAGLAFGPARKGTTQKEN